jgi:hypothetical protein
MDSVAIRYKNKMHIVHKLRHETNDRAITRLWYIVKYKEENPDISEKELNCLSHIYVNERYMEMKY